VDELRSNILLSEKSLQGGGGDAASSSRSDLSCLDLYHRNPQDGTCHLAAVAVSIGRQGFSLTRGYRVLEWAHVTR
jgi:hypothetical protein